MPEPTFEWVDIDEIRPNRWNPNVMDDEMYRKAIESIHKFGFVDPVTCRIEVDKLADGPKVTFYELIDGEHRWKAAHDHGNCVRALKGKGWERHRGMQKLPVTNLGVVTDTIAEQMTIVLNETRGTYDPKKMGELLTELVAVETLPDLIEVLPFDQPKFEELAALPHVDWDAIGPGRRQSPRAGERWVERVYRLSPEGAEALDQAVRQVRDDNGSTEAEAIETIARHFLRA